MKLSKKAQLLKPSPTLAMAAKAKEMMAKGMDVVSLTVGEPDWPTLSKAKEAGVLAIQQDFTKYTVASGIPELKAAIAKRTSEEMKVPFAANEVCVTSGAKYAIYAALEMVLDPGDEVLIPAPYWVSYPTMVELANGVPKIIECNADVDFKLTAEKLESALGPKTKVLILCSPSNPTGKMHNKTEIAELAKVIKKNPGLIVISDDIYNRLVFDGSGIAPHLLHADPTLKDQLILINGASKSFAMTGWRVGWATGPKAVIQQMGDFCSQTTSNPSSISQKAVIQAIEQGNDEVQKSIAVLTARKQFCVDLFAPLKHLKISSPEGAFYLWMDIRGVFGKTMDGLKIKSSSEVSQILLEKFLVATVPGLEFGCEGYIRLSFAASNADLEKAVGRFKEFEKALS